MSANEQSTHGSYMATSILASVGVASSAWSSLREDWRLIDDLCGGTMAMRTAGTKWLPKLKAEDPDIYNTRKDRTFLYNGYGDTISRVSTKPFSKPVVMTESDEAKLPERLRPMIRRCDVSGSNLTEFSKGLMEAAAKYGMVGTVIDFPATGDTQNLRTEMQTKPTPYFIMVLPRDILGWQTQTGLDGQIEFTEVRIRETRVEQKDNDYNEIVTEYVRAYRKDSYSLYKKDKNGTFEHVETNSHTFGAVPFKMFYVAKTGFMMADPPFRDLAYINCRHWQSSSEQTNILGVARCGILLATGFQKDELSTIVVGPNHVIKTTNENAKLEWVEHAGLAIPSGENDLAQLEAKMQILGLQPFVQRNSGATATGVAIDETRANTEVEAWCRALEVFLFELFEAAAKWLGLKLDSKLKIDINTDFGISVRTVEDCRMLLDLYRACPASAMLEMVISEFRRRGVMSEHVDVQVLIDKIDSENPLAMIARAGNGESSQRIGGVSNFGGKAGVNGLKNGQN